MEKITEFDFSTCAQTGETTDPGGNLAPYLIERKEDCHLIHQEWTNDMYLVTWQKKFRELCKIYQIQPWYDIFDFLGTTVFHFRGLSNWMKHPQEFLDAKKALILEALTEFQSTY